MFKAFCFNKDIWILAYAVIEKAIGKYLIFIDIDDWIEDDYIEILLNEIENNKLDFVTIGYNDISKYGVFSVNDFYKKNKTLKQ